ncbi:Disease resistance protein RPS6 [Vitis vinifera]|uniref:ADP-ribosyl cyclase/cyclic ADP-ribose hydrolase n=1 Tax=Vitis vinifera TaxID=29760 RepID=A0A438IWE0_VITVI|nr:Disease resistance protein RPS6 [Vitis vinifera]
MASSNTQKPSSSPAPTGKFNFDVFLTYKDHGVQKRNGSKVLPVFYHVDPSDVRKQTGSFGKAFAKHGTTVDEQKVKRWRAAMTEASSLSGWHVIKDYE